MHHAAARPVGTPTTAQTHLARATGAGRLKLNSQEHTTIVWSLPKHAPGDRVKKALLPRASLRRASYSPLPEGLPDPAGGDNPAKQGKAKGRNAKTNPLGAGDGEKGFGYRAQRPIAATPMRRTGNPARRAD